MPNKKTTRKLSYLFFLIIISLLFIYFVFKNITSSVFLKNKERVNVVFYSENTSFFSLSTQDVNYFIKFPADIEVLVPGGYGNYKIGGLGKLISLEKKPDILKRTFSALTSCFVDLYFYPKETKIYYKTEDNSYFPAISQILFFKSNANFIDRMILLTKLFDRNQSKYRNISNLPLLKDKQKTIFDRQHFIKDFQGSFYKESYRSTETTVQLIYSESYSTSLLLSDLIDGEGIRVVDMTETDQKMSNCQVISKKNSYLTHALASFFNCQEKIGETEISDIIIKLGSLEKTWAVK